MLIIFYYLILCSKVLIGFFPPLNHRKLAGGVLAQLKLVGKSVLFIKLFKMSFIHGKQSDFEHIISKNISVVFNFLMNIT